MIRLFIPLLFIMSATLYGRLSIQQALNFPLSDTLIQVALLKGLLGDWLLVNGCLAPALFFRKGLRLTQWLFIGLFWIIIADTLYFHYTFTHLEPILFENLNPFAIRGFINLTTLGYFGLILLITGIFWSLNRYALRLPLNRNGRRLIVGNVIIASGLLLALQQPYFLPTLTPLLSNIAQNIEKNRVHYRQLLETSALINFIHSFYLTLQWRAKSSRVNSFQPYSATERAYLESLGLLKTPPSPISGKIAPYRTIVLIALESMHRDYLHTYNPNIPPETTPFLDSLIARYPHADHYFTSAMPTTQGLNATLKSQLDLRPEFSLQHREDSLFSLLQKQAGMTGFFVRSVTGQFDGDNTRYPCLFRMNYFMAAEELSHRYPPPNQFAQLQGWGYDDATLYTEGVRILKNQRDRPTFLVLNTIDLHVPHVCRYDYQELPEAIRKHPNYSLLCAIYDTDKALATFFQAIETAGWLDEKHLFIITADHVPYVGPEQRPTMEPRNYLRLDRIPLIFVSGDVTLWQSLKSDAFASQIDLAPTILEIMGITPPQEFLGTNLLKSRQPAFALGFYRSQEGEQLFYTRADTAFVADLSQHAENTTISAEQKITLKKWFENRYAVH